jgi:hypothetical protein
MIIGFKKRFLFIHIPKCAGDSMRELLLKPENSGALFLGKHAGYRGAEKAMGEAINGFTVFAVVRNPFDQAVSFYKHLRKPLHISAAEIDQQYPGRDGRLLPLWASELAMSVAFPEFVRQVYGVAGDTREQAHWFRDSLDWLVSSEGKIAADRILRFETLQEDYSKLAAELGLVGDLPIRGASFPPRGETDYREHYDDEARRIIGERFRPTLEAFGYRF